MILSRYILQTYTDSEEEQYFVKSDSITYLYDMTQKYGKQQLTTEN